MADNVYSGVAGEAMETWFGMAKAILVAAPLLIGIGVAIGYLIWGAAW